MRGDLLILKEFLVLGKFKLIFKVNIKMHERQLVCYPRNGTCSLRESVCCVLLTSCPF